jgi:hypothetical protein
MDIHASRKAVQELNALYAEMNNPQSHEVEEGYKEIDREKENKMYRRAGNLARTALSSRGKKKEDAMNKSGKIVSAITRQKEKERFSKMADIKARDNYKEEVENVDEMIDPKGAARIDAAKKKNKVDVFAYDRKLQAQGKLKGKKLPPPPTNEEVENVKETLDPVGKEDKDIDNDGDVDKSDKYLHKRRKAIGKAIAKKKGMSEQEEKIGGKTLKGMASKATKRIDADVDGDVDKNDPKAGPMGEFVPTPDGKKRLYTGVKKESFSNWRDDLREIVDTEEQDKQIKEKKVKNKVVIDPELKLEAIAHELGAEIVEFIELDEGSLRPGESYMQYGKRKQAERTAAATDKRMTVTNADKKANTPAYQKYKAGDKRYKMVGEESEQLDEKALSKAQQRFMGAVYAAKKGETPASPEIAKAAAGMTKKQAKDFAGTKHKGLPEKKVAKEEVEQIDERRREDKGKPRPAEPSAAFKAVSKMMGSSRFGVQPRGVKKKPGKKPPVAGEFGAPRSPAQKLAAKRAAAKRSQNSMSSRFD